MTFIRHFPLVVPVSAFRSHFPRTLLTRKIRVWPQKGQDEKRCEIQGVGQEVAVMVG